MQNTILCFSKVGIVWHFSVKNLLVKNVDWVTSKYWLSKVYFAKLYAWGSRGVNILTKFKQLFRHFSWNSIFWLLLFRKIFALQVLPIFLQSIMLLVALNCRKPFFFIWTENNNLEKTNIFFSSSISEMSATPLTQLKQFYSSRLYHPRKSSSSLPTYILHRHIY